jgi:hypothetical protein
MKKLLLAAAIFCSMGAMAQDSKMDDAKMDHKMKDCVMMKDGKMMTMMDGKTMVMDKDMTLSNGTMVMTNGMMKTKKGKMMQLKEGESVTMDGKMTKMKKAMEDMPAKN